MTSATLALSPGVRIRVRVGDADPELWTYHGRSRTGGYRVSRPGQDPVVWPKDEMTRLRLDESVEIYPGDPEMDDEQVAYLLSRTFASFPEEYQIIAERRVDYLREAKRRVEAGETLDGCLPEVAESVFADRKDEWEKQDIALKAVREEQARKRRKKSPDQLKRPKKGQPLKAPNPQTIGVWYRTWIRYGEDIRVLIPAFNLRGQSGPRYDPWMYDKMRELLEEFFLKKLSPDLMFAYRQFEKHCEGKGLNLDEAKKAGKPRPYPSYPTFLAFKNKEIAARDELKERTSSREAYLTFNVFKRQGRPGKVLAEVEIDHCLIDLIVVDPVSGRALGRPWLTATLDRASSMIPGCHLSFAPPSYATVQRCLAHSFWPKDLRGYPDLENPWPCEGIFGELFVDNGKEFRSMSLKRSERAMNFWVRPLPVMSPWLKGKIERFFGRFNIQVLGHKEGKTFWNAAERGEYRSIKRAEWDLPQVQADVLRYLVDDYHVAKHRGLRDARPLDVWNELIERQNGIRPVPRQELLVELTGQVEMRPLGNDGININGLNYWSSEFTALREDLGRSKEWVECRFDPFDMRDIAVLNRVRGFHIRADCTNSKISHGVSFAQSKLHLREARVAGTKGKVTEDDIERSKLKAEADADEILGNAGRNLSTAKRAAVYRAPNGLFFTPIGGQRGLADEAPSGGDTPTQAPSKPVAQAEPPDSVTSEPTAADAGVLSAADLHLRLEDEVEALSAQWEEN